MRLALTLAVALQAADALTFVVLVQVLGLGAEANPFMRALGVPLALLCKLLAVVFVLRVLPRCGLPSRFTAHAAAHLVACLGLIGAASNVATLAHP